MQNLVYAICTQEPKMRMKTCSTCPKLSFNNSIQSTGFCLLIMQFLFVDELSFKWKVFYKQVQWFVKIKIFVVYTYSKAWFSKKMIITHNEEPPNIFFKTKHQKKTFNIIRGARVLLILAQKQNMVMNIYNTFYRMFSFLIWTNFLWLCQYEQYIDYHYVNMHNS